MTLKFSDNVLGAINVTGYTTTAPGNGGLPSVTLEPQLGEIRKAWDTTLGAMEVIYLMVPASTAITAGLLYTYTSGYTATVLPVLATSKNTGDWISVALTTLASTTSVNYGWFQIQGQANVLKTAVTVSPNVNVYASATAGRIKVLTSAGGQIWGMKTFNAATVTSTTSTVLCYLQRPIIEGQIT